MADPRLCMCYLLACPCASGRDLAEAGAPLRARVGDGFGGEPGVGAERLGLGRQVQPGHGPGVTAAHVARAVGAAAAGGPLRGAERADATGPVA